MIGDAATARTRRAVVGGAVLLAHAVVLMVMALARPDRPSGEAPRESLLVTMMIGEPLNWVIAACYLGMSLFGADRLAERWQK